MGAQAATTDDPVQTRSEPPEHAIRQRSREIWEREGRPEGHAEEHWARARAELAEQMAKLASAQLATLHQTSLILAAPPQTAATRTSDDINSALGWLAQAEAAAPTTPSIIHGGLLLRGDLESPGDLHFDGTLEGNIRATSLDIGKEAAIQGDVVARELTVRGTVRGRICANKVLLCAGCRVDGEVHYRTLTIETGARLDSRFRHLDRHARHAVGG